MSRILYLTFFFEPDLSAGSFRNTSLAKELAARLGNGGHIDLFTTLPNRYHSFEQEAEEKVDFGNLHVHRVLVPKHKSGMAGQIYSFRTFYKSVKKSTASRKYDLVFASSSKFFTAYLGFKIAKKKNIPLYLDVRDIFYDTLKDILKKDTTLKSGVLPFIKRLERKVFDYASHINLISGGFEPYFQPYTHAHYSIFPNGIDREFIHIQYPERPVNTRKTIMYAGNIGEGQGLEKILAPAAKILGADYRFLIIGDGARRGALERSIEALQVHNIEIRKPVPRKELLKLYAESDYFFIHLNDYEAFKKVLPSKVFELGALNKPIIAGVSGFASEFMRENVSNIILFDPGDVEAMTSGLQAYTYHKEKRTGFIEKFKREKINRDMAASILSYLPANTY